MEQRNTFNHNTFNATRCVYRILYSFFISLFLSIAFSSQAYSAIHESIPLDAELPLGTWVTEIEGVGNIVITCRKDNHTCNVFWVFEELTLNASITGDVLELSEPNGKGISLRIKMSKDIISNNIPDKFIIDNTLLNDMPNNFSMLKFKDNWKPYSHYSDPRKSGDYTIYHNAGDLLPLPENFPAWFMNPTLMLFMQNSQSRNSSIAVDIILQHHSLTTETLHKAVTYYSNDDSRSYRYPIIAKHPNLGKPDLKRLFYEDVSPRYKPEIWNAVSMSSNAPAHYRSEYYQRIKQADRRLLNEFLDDKNAPADLLDWYARTYINNRLSFQNSLFLNKNISSETIDFILTSKNYYINSNNNADTETLSKIVVLPNISEQSRKKIIQISISNLLTKDVMVRKIIWAISRNTELSSPSISNLIKKMALSKHAEMRKLAAQDPRLPPDLIEYFLKTEEIDVRVRLCRNPALTLDQLTTLANDSYRIVRDDAVYSIKKRFPEAHENIVRSLPPKSELNDAIFVVVELGVALKNNNKHDISRIIPLIHKFNLNPEYVFSVGPAIASGNQELVELVMSEMPDSLTAYRFFSDENYSAKWFQLFLDNGWLDQLDSFEVMHYAAINWHIGSFIKLALHGFEINPTSKRSKRSLISTLTSDSGILFYGAMITPFIMQVIALLMVFSSKNRSNTKPYWLAISSYILLLPALLFLIFSACFFGCSGGIDGIWALLIIATILTTVVIIKGRINKKKLRTAAP